MTWDRRWPWLGHGLVLIALAAPRAGAEEVSVFAAASLTDVLREIVAAWEAASSNRVVFSFGASSDLARQIRAGAAADLFFSADAAQMDRLEKEGLVRPRDRLDVLSNSLAVIVPLASPAKLEAPVDLLRFEKLALADPEAVPAGVYARAWLESQGLWARLKDRVVPTLDVRAALSAVESENVQAGIVYGTDARLSKRSRLAYRVPRDQGPSIVYPLARLAASNKPATSELLRHLVAPPAREVYARYGFEVLRGR